MNIFISFLRLFVFEQEEKLEIEAQNKGLISNLFNFFVFLIVFIEGVYSLLLEKTIFAVPLLFFSLAFAFHFLYLGRRYQSQAIRNTMLTFVLLVMIFFIVFGCNSGLSIVWVALFPSYVLFIYGKHVGTVISLTFFGFILLALFVFLPYVPYSATYTLEQNILFSIFYFVVFLLAYSINHVSSEIILYKERNMLDSKNVSKTQEELISKLSHQIRTPLSNITGIIDILEKTNLSEEQRDYINTIHASSNNLVSVVNSIVAVSKTTFNQAPEEEISFNIYATLNNTIKLFQDNQGKKKFNISLSADIPSVIIGNSIKSKQIFLNLLNSIIKYGKEELTTITIEVSRKESMPGYANLKFRIISNTDIPLQKDDLARRDSHSSDIIHLNTAKYVSLLDLGMTQKLIEMDGNSITISSDSMNTTIEFTASYKESTKSQSVASIREVLKPVKEVHKVKVDLQNANILLVEDNFSNQQIIILYIKNEVMKIDVAFNGKEALDKFGKAKYDLILMDVQMPIMDGFKATQKIRELEKSTGTHTPIIAVTANAFPEDKERCLASGMDDYISKPFQPEDLINKIKKHLSS